jgi:hypothetical protein
MSFVIHFLACTAAYILWVAVLFPRMERARLLPVIFNLPAYFLLALLVMVVPYIVAVLVSNYFGVEGGSQPFPALFNYLLLFYLIRRRLKLSGHTFNFILFKDEVKK